MEVIVVDQMYVTAVVQDIVVTSVKHVCCRKNLDIAT